MNATPTPPEPPAQGAADDAPIDLGGGLARVMGDQRIFALVLERFGSDYRDATASIRAALDAGDTPLAQRLIHNLKGAAGMIEARPLQRQALALEQALRGQPGGWEQQLGRLGAELDRVLRALDAMPSPQAVRAARPQAASVDGAQALARLAVLLDTGDGAALDLVEDARDALEVALGAARSREVAAAVSDFDFERALALLEGPAGSP